MSYNEKLQALVERYREDGNSWPATAREIAAWMIRNRLWEPSQEAVLARCADELSRALRDEYFTDRQGRRVRAKHAARLSSGPHQAVMWADMRTDAREFIDVAFSNRREQIVGDCRQLKTDVDSYDENWNPGEPIPLSLDMTLDIAELEALKRQSA